MWWKRFLEHNDAIELLPIEKLENMNQSALSQLEKMQDQENTLQSQINDVSLEICTALATENNSSLMKNFVNISAEEQRYRQLKATFNTLLYEREICEHEIMSQETMQSQMNMGDKKFDLPMQIRQICTKLAEVATSTDDVTLRDDCLMSLDLVTGNMKLIPTVIKQNKTFFQRKSAELRSELDDLIRKTAKTVKKVSQLSGLLEDTIQKTDVLGPMLPKVKQQLEDELCEFGDTRERLLAVKRHINELKSERDELKNECSALSTEILSKPMNSGLSAEEMDKMIELKQRKVRLLIQDNEVLQKHHLIESEIRGVREEIENTKDEIREVDNQTKLLRSAIEEQKWKSQLLQNARVTPTDFQAVFKCSRDGTLEELEKTLEEKEEYLKLMERKHANVQEKGAKLLEQEGSMDEQIKNLRELISAAQLEE